MTELPAYSTVLSVRSEILDNETLLDVVDLGHAGGPDAAPAARKRGKRRRLADRAPVTDAHVDADAFFALTYPTEDVKQTLYAIQTRLLDPRAVSGTILLNGRYGLGKSHVLLAAHHALHRPGVCSAWARRWGIEPLKLAPDVRVITRNFIQKTAENLWQVFFEALGRPELTDQVTTYPDGEQIRSALDERPTFFVLDELERWYDALPAAMQSRNRNFLQALTEVARHDGRVTLITSVLGEQMEPAETLRRVRPLELSFRSTEDRQQVLLYRLFENRHQVEDSAIAGTVDAYLSAYRRVGLDNLDSYRQRMLATYPFTPEFLDIITKKIPNLGGFQNTRGSLRFLSQVVQTTHGSRPLVSSQDLPLDKRELATALSNLDSTGGEVVRRALGDNLDAVPDSLPHKRELFSAILFYSIADPSQPGVGENDLLLAVLDPAENPNLIKDSVRQLHSLAFNLHLQNDRYVFLAQENPHARINAVARSPQVTEEAWRAIVVDALRREWGARERTVLYTGDIDKASRELAAMGRKRPLYLISTRVLTPALRLDLQNCHAARNLVLLIEPRFDAERRQSQHYDIVADTALRERARHIQACNLLLESKPDEAAATVYRDVARREMTALRGDIAHRYGRYIDWNQAGGSDAAVDDSWYEFGQLERFDAGQFLEQIKRNYSGIPHILARVRSLWSEYRTRRARDLIEHFDRTPGEPVPYDPRMVANALRELAKEGLFGLQSSRGQTYCRGDVADLAEDDLPGCVLVQAPSVTHKAPEPLLTHQFVAARYDADRKTVTIQWEFPDSPHRLETLVQRYPNAKGWEPGKEYKLDLDTTHENNRYLGAADHMVDGQNLTPGARYYYYVFAIDRHVEPPRIVLSQRCDVQIQEEALPPPANEIHVAIQPKHNKLLSEIERRVMSARYMSSDKRARKLEFQLTRVRDPGALLDLAKNLERDGATIDISADVSVTVRGTFDRQNILQMTRALPRVEAGYGVRITLITDDDGPGDDA